ncbi:TonB-dependent receptor [Neptunomonas sp. XY-337]|uniref:TonB-dependent receptor domain-containing protein n=1 Tax=Neptunomonas sp. XY-337 TaxID=2561897 RepID=UPI0010AA86C2|nr:TonB-dependent receptor [Neptunomonas sp. XY-337]
MTLPTHQRLLYLAIATAVASTAHADSNAVNAEKVTVTGSANPAEQQVEQVTLERYQATDLEDIFRQTPEVSVGGGFSTAQKVYVRGVEDINLNISVDGAQQAGYMFHHQGQLNIEPELIKRVEVNAGAGLATDGPGALGGAIRFITKDPEDLLRDGEKAGMLLKAGYYDNADGYKVSANAFGRVNDNISVLAALTRQDTDNIVDGRGNELTNTKSEIDSGLFKVVGHITPDQTVRLSHEIRNDDGRRNVRPHFISAGWNQDNQQQSRRKTTNVQYELTPNNPNVNVRANVYHTDAYITQQPDGEAEYGAGVESFGYDLRNTMDLGQHRVTVGTDYRNDTGYYINPEADGPQLDEELDVIGVYVQDEFALNAKTTLHAGVRYDHYDLDDNIGQNFSHSGFSPNVGVDYAVNDALTLRAGYAQALRGANVKEAFLLNWATNDPNRKAEEAENFEVGFDYQMDALSFGSTAYVMSIDNAISRISRSVVGNAGDVKVKGISAYLGYRLDNTEFNLGYSHNRPELDGEPLDDGNMGIGTSIGDTLTASLTHEMPALNLELGWSTELVKRLTRLDAERAEKPGYGVHDVYAKWLPTGSEDLSLTLTVKNLFDKQYLNHASYGVSTSSGNIIGLPEPGRDIRLTLATRF